MNVKDRTQSQLKIRGAPHPALPKGGREPPAARIEFKKITLFPPSSSEFTMMSAGRLRLAMRRRPTLRFSMLLSSGRLAAPPFGLHRRPTNTTTATHASTISSRRRRRL